MVKANENKDVFSFPSKCNLRTCEFYVNESKVLKFRLPVKNPCFKEGSGYKNGLPGSLFSLCLSFSCLTSPCHSFILSSVSANLSSADQLGQVQIHWSGDERTLMFQRHYHQVLSCYLLPFSVSVNFCITQTVRN